MTPAEKQRLYHAIDYQENSAAVEYPEEYVATSCKFMLYLLEIDVKDDSLLRPVITARLKNVYCEVDLRPAASALKYNIFFFFSTFLTFLTIFILESSRTLTSFPLTDLSKIMEYRN